MSARPPEELIARHEAFLAGAPTDRPLLGFWLGGYFPAEQFSRGVAAWTDGQALRPDNVRLAAFAADYERLYHLHRDVHDDFFYVASAYWGIPWLEAILGCPVRSGPMTCWAEPCIQEMGSWLDRPVNLDENAWFQCLVNFTKGLVAVAAGRFPVGAPLLRGPGDAASALCGPMNMMTGYLDAPDGMRRLLEHCAQVRLEVVRRLHEVIPSWFGTHAAGGYPSKVWSKKSVAYNQEDSAALLSPTLFRDFLLPLERRQCEAAEINFIHLHSSCLWPVDLLLEDHAYAVLEINIDHEGAGPSLPKLMPTFKKIQAARRPLLLWGDISPADWRLLRDELNPAGLSIQPILAHAAGARAFAEEIRGFS